MKVFREKLIDATTNEQVYKSVKKQIPLVIIYFKYYIQTYIYARTHMHKHAHIYVYIYIYIYIYIFRCMSLCVCVFIRVLMRVLRLIESCNVKIDPPTESSWGCYFLLRQPWSGSMKKLSRSMQQRNVHRSLRYCLTLMRKSNLVTLNS